MCVAKRRRGRISRGVTEVTHNKVIRYTKVPTFPKWSREGQELRA